MSRKLSRSGNGTLAIAAWMGKICVAVFTAVMLCLPAQATPRQAAASGLWSATGTWGGTVPQAGDDVLIGAAYTVTQDVSSAVLNSCTNSGTLVFDGWSYVLTASNVIVTSGGKITHNKNTAPLPPYTPDKRVNLACTNLNVQAGGTINADSQGFRGGQTQYASGCGPGYTTGLPYAVSGAGYGGVGGNCDPNVGGNGTPPTKFGGATYGSVTAPTDPGSGSGTYQGTAGGDGGGAILIAANGTVTVDGAITAVGQKPANSSAGGSGGSIYITCQTIRGAGVVAANGGDAPINVNSAGGGGGRIAVVYDTTAQAGVSPKPTIAFAAAGGTQPSNLGTSWAAAGGVPYPSSHFTGWQWGNGDPGTIWLSDTNFFPTTTLAGGRIVIPGFTSWSPATLTITNGLVSFPANFQLTVNGNLTCSGRGGIELTNSVLTVNGDWTFNNAAYGMSRLWGGPAASASVAGNLTITNGWLELRGSETNLMKLAVGGNLTLTNAGAVYVFNGPVSTNTGAFPCATLISVIGSVAISSNTWIYPWSDFTNGGSALIQANSVNIRRGGGINANGKGFSGGFASYGAGFGPGCSTGATYAVGGAGYGGAAGAGTDMSGGTSASAGGGIYPSVNAPTQPGSGSGRYQNSDAAFGGGLVWIQATNAITVDGTITANGQQSGNGDRGGGSGGGVYLVCDTLQGAGSIQANGANATGKGGAGGGGRVAVIYNITDQAAATPKPTIAFAAGGGYNSNGNDTSGRADQIRYKRGQPGTLYFSDANFYPRTNLLGGWIVISNCPPLALASLSISGDMAGMPVGVPITIANDVVITGAGGLAVSNCVASIGGKFRMDTNTLNTAMSKFYGGPNSQITITGDTTVQTGWMEWIGGLTNGNTLNLGGNLLVTNGGILHVYSGITNTVITTGGVNLVVAGNVMIATNSWIYPYSEPTNGGSPYLRMRTLTVATNAGIDASTRGFRGGRGSYQTGMGKGASLSAAYAVGGAGYGGAGGSSSYTVNFSLGGGTYGSSNAPIDPGSGSGTYQGNNGANGGGLIRLQVDRDLTVNGVLKADGESGSSTTSGSGGGSGGGVYVRCRNLGGSGQITADGGTPSTSTAGASGGGGGGRVAVWSVRNTFGGAAHANGGTGYTNGSYVGSNGAPGSVVWGTLPLEASVLIVR